MVVFGSLVADIRGGFLMTVILCCLVSDGGWGENFISPGAGQINSVPTGIICMSRGSYWYWHEQEKNM